MKFKKLFPLITATHIEVYSRNGEVLIDDRSEEVPWDKVEEIKNRQVVMIYCYDKSDDIPEEDGDTIIVTVEDELKLKGVKNGSC
ncbi:hypothetical protein [Acidaminococcus intestini]|jgi:hypothetical protein|uniref:hypothetical protein n=1 Tax=Acidaminococcus intestini TaxID=187327 RepID=UPI002045E6B2|nr:hypothetical protein [Acidaminococcus intestini]DAP59536.1 MAG TPA: hypothetical protein [Caudoviricetes sp.]